MTASRNRNQMAMIAAPMMPAITPSKKTIARIFILHLLSGVAPGLLEHWIETTSEVVSILMGWIPCGTAMLRLWHVPPYRIGRRIKATDNKIYLRLLVRPWRG